jgi:DNA-3-methyladenine glycosylase II
MNFTKAPGRLGCCRRKVRTLRDLAEQLTDGRLNVDALSRLPDEEPDGGGHRNPWDCPQTVQGGLFIALQPEDVALPGDLALPKAVQAACQLRRLPTTEQEIIAIAETWRPAAA